MAENPLADLECVSGSVHPTDLTTPLSPTNAPLCARRGTVINPQQSVELIQSTSFALAALHTLWLKCVRSWNPHPKSWSRSLPPIPHRRSEAVGTALVDSRSRRSTPVRSDGQPGRRRRAAVRVPNSHDGSDSAMQFRRNLRVGGSGWCGFGPNVGPQVWKNRNFDIIKVLLTALPYALESPR